LKRDFRRHAASTASELRLSGDSSDQIAALKSAFGAWKKLRSPSEDEGASPARKRFLADFSLDDSLLDRAIAVGCALSALAGLVFMRTRRRREQGLPPSYTKALAILAREGLVRAPSETARHFAAQVAATTPREATNAFRAITGSYLAQRFGRGAPRDETASVARLRAALRRGGVGRAA